jgi:hypothetical protein
MCLAKREKNLPQTPNLNERLFMPTVHEVPLEKVLFTLGFDPVPPRSGIWWVLA